MRWKRMMSPGARGCGNISLLRANTSTPIPSAQLPDWLSPGSVMVMFMTISAPRSNKWVSPAARLQESVEYRAGRLGRGGGGGGVVNLSPWYFLAVSPPARSPRSSSGCRRSLGSGRSPPGEPSSRMEELDAEPGASYRGLGALLHQLTRPSDGVQRTSGEQCSHHCSWSLRQTALCGACKFAQHAETSAARPQRRHQTDSPDSTGCVACKLSSAIVRAGGHSPARAWLMHPRELHC